MGNLDSRKVYHCGAPVYVSNDFQGKGIGKLLLKESIVAAKKSKEFTP
jgi:predicted N-acetyltransferase YhbS